METTSFENLDLACARIGQEIAKNPSAELKSCLTDALSVLEEQGLYALFLFLANKDKNNIIKKNLQVLLETTPKQNPLFTKRSGSDVFERIREDLSDQLDALFLACDLVRQTLIYARYHARVEPKAESEEDDR